MGRLVKDVAITAPGRDHGKVFVITEMSAAQSEKWALRALLLAAQSGAEVADAMSGMAGIATAGIQAVLGGVKFAEVEPLLDEMMRCIQIRPDAGSHDPARAQLVRPLIDDDTEEIATRATLRAEVFALHVGFSFADALSSLKVQSGTTSAGSQNTATSPLP